MKRRGLFLIIVFIAVIVPSGAFAYDNDIAHPGIAELAAKLYNEKFDPDLTNEEIEWIKQGAREEDFPTRWLNHFWDPIYKTGFSDLAGLSFSKTILDWFNLTSVYSAPNWLQNPTAQHDYSLGDRSWETGLLDHAYNNRKMAFIELGHAVHLISDMSVSAHTRNSEHIGDPYEGYVKANWNNIAPTINTDITTISNLNSIFNSSALYSNNNFYSEKTIESTKYKIIVIERTETRYEKNIPFLYYSNQNGYIYCSVGANWKNTQLTTSKQIILSSYAQHLIPKAVGDSAGMIKFFLDEAEQKKQEVAGKSLLARLTDKLNSAIRISRLGLLNQALGYLIGGGEKVKDYYEAEFAQTSVEQTPAETVKIAGLKIVSSTSAAPEAEPLQQNTITSPFSDESDIPEETTDNNFERFLGLLPLEQAEEEVAVIQTSSTVYSPFAGGSSSSGASVSNTPAPEPQEKAFWPTPVPDAIFSEVLYTSSSMVQVFGTCDANTQSIFVFAETETSSSTQITASTNILENIWTADLPLVTGWNIFRFRAAGNSDFQISGFSPSSEIVLDSEPPSAPVINFAISTSTTSTLLTFALSSADNYSGDIFYDLEMASGSDWIVLTQNSTSTDFPLYFDKSGDYIFRAQAIDTVGNQSEYAEATIAIEPLDYQYTYLSGTQSETERILTAEESPYLLDNYRVPKGKNLIISPGTIIKGTGRLSLLSATGNLIVNGEENNRIIFTSLGDRSFDTDRLNTLNLDSTEAAPEAWEGVIIADGSNSTMSYVDIRFAGGGNTIDNNLFPSLDTRRAIYLTKANLIIDNCIFSNNARYAIVASIGFQLNVNNSEFRGIDRYFNASNGNGTAGGIALRNGTANIFNSSFKSMTKFPIEVGTSVTLSTDNLIFENNLFNEIIYQTTAYGRYRGDGFYVLENQPLNTYTQPHFEPGKTTYIMGPLTIQNGDYTLQGSDETRLKVTLLPEFGGRINVINGSLNISEVDLVRPLPNLPSLANNSFGSYFHLPVLWNSEMSYADLWQANLALINSEWGNKAIVDVENGHLSIENSTITNYQFPYKYFIFVKNNSVANISDSRLVLENDGPIITDLISALGTQGIGAENNGIFNVSSTEFLNLSDIPTSSTSSSKS